MPIINEVQIVLKVKQAKKEICCIEICSRNTMVPFKVRKIGVFIIKYFILVWAEYLIKINKYKS